MRKPKFEILAGKNGKFYFHLKAANGEVILSSRSFKTKPEAIHAIASVMRYAPLESCIVRRDAINGQHFFRVKTLSGRILAWSELYHHKQGLETGILSVKNAVNYARIFELEQSV